MSAKIISGAFMHSEANKVLKGKIVHAVNVRGCEAHLTFADGTILEIKPSKTRGDQLWFDLYEYQPAQTKLSFTAWREYRQVDGDLVKCFAEFFREFSRYVENFGPMGYRTNFHSLTYLLDRIVESFLHDPIKPSKFGELTNSSQILIEWDWLNSNQQEPAVILFSTSYQNLYCDVSVESSVLTARIYKLKPNSEGCTKTS